MKVPDLNTKDLLVDTDLTDKEIYSLFDYTAYLKKLHKKGKKHEILRGKTLGMIFEKSSTRTRVSFEAGMFQLGGHALFLNPNDIQLGRGEPLKDTARVLSRYVDGIMIRTYGQDKVETIAQYASIPVINGLTDEFHPCQALTDYFTMMEQCGPLKGKKLTFIGDGNNMAHSLILTGAILGVNVSIATPAKYEPKKEIVKIARGIAQMNGCEINITADIKEAAKGADVLYTDVWASMGQEKQTSIRKKAFAKYKISLDLIRKHAPNAKVMHCLPAHRGEEIDEDVLESSYSIVFDEAENRMHLQKALLCGLIKR